jgi:TolB-like protein/DNA-binding winged helix-turn-helix (wHTH) protein
MKTTQLYEFDDFRIDPIRRSVHRLDDLIHLPPKVFATLLTLVQHHGTVIEKSVLIDAVWPDTIVEENNLTQNISAIRRALGGDSERQRYVVTIPGHGYSFVADVREIPRNGLRVEIDDEEAAVEQLNDPRLYEAPVRRSISARYKLLRALAAILGVVAIAAVWVISRDQPKSGVTANRSIAVLPFQPVDGEPSDRYIGTGMADALMTKLSNIGQINVRSTSSMLRRSGQTQDAPAEGRELGVDFVIDGHFQRQDDRLRMTVQLIRTSDGATLWAKPFDERFTDVFALQDSISEQAASALKLTLSGAEHRQIKRRYTEHTGAYLAYMQAAYLMREPGSDKLKKSIDYYQQAVDLDPKYALAYAGLADSYMRLHARGILIGKTPSIDLARTSLSRSLELDNTVAYAHSMRGFIAFRYEWDFPKAEREYHQARTLDPNYVNSWFGFYLMTVNRFGEAEAEFTRYREARPLDSDDLSLYYFFLHQYDLAERELKSSLAIDPVKVNRAYLGMVYEQKGLMKEALGEFDKGRKQSADSVTSRGHVAHAFAMSGKASEARKILADMLKMSSSDYFSANYMVAVVSTGLGENDTAISYLEKAYDEHSLGPAWFKFDPRLDSLRENPRFQAFMRRIGLLA